MIFQPFKLAGVAVLSAVLLSACGGGGDAGAPPVRSTLPFHLNDGYKALVQSVATHSFDVSGNCIGTYSITTGPSVVASPPFEGVAGSIASPQTSKLTITSCAPGLVLASSGPVTGNTYYDGISFAPIGLHVDNGEYAVNEPPLPSPTALPATVTGGAPGGTIVTLNSYQTGDASAPQIGTRVLSYQIHDDTKTTVFLDMFNKSYDMGGELLSTEQTRYRMAENGSLTMLWIRVVGTTMVSGVPTPYTLTYGDK